MPSSSTPNGQQQDQQQQHSAAIKQLLQALVPKNEIGVSQFLENHPDFDGRGVKIAIFDTGVDVGIEGLRITTDGRVKIVDAVDTTGSGDVDTSKSVSIDADGCVTALSGRRFRVPASWNVASHAASEKDGKRSIQVGLKRAYELFPSGLVDRLRDKRKEAFQKATHQLATQLKQALLSFKPSSDADADAQLWKKSDLEEQYKQFNDMIKNFDDPGPLLDVFVWRDASSAATDAATDATDDNVAALRAVVYCAPDFDAEIEQLSSIAMASLAHKSGKQQKVPEPIDLSQARVLRDYAIAQEWSTLSLDDLMNYSLKFYEQGNVLSIVVPSGTHGSHVAGIAAAYYPEQPELNGIAPGAQIVTVKIGDGRLGSMETTLGITRGIIAAYQNKCHLVNMSYGEASKVANFGRVRDMLDELVWQHNCIFVGSASNSGPALSTVGAPAGSTESALGIGAYISPVMMLAQYSVRQANPEQNYTWSSRGPSLDGAQGPVFSSCGGAISPVPNYFLSKNQQMNGTSMSSPSACGGIALLLSGLMAHGLEWNAYYVRRLMQNSATKLEGHHPLELGSGLMNVDRAFEMALRFPYDPTENVRYQLEVMDRSAARGIYLREPFETSDVQVFSIKVYTRFHKDAPNVDKVKFEKRFRLVSTQPWIEAPQFFYVSHEPDRLFSVKVDPTSLSVGSAVHFGEVLAYDVDREDFGPVFALPVTVVRPIEPPAVVKRGGSGSDSRRRCIVEYKDLKFRDSHRERRFFGVPAGATHVRVHLTCVKTVAPSLFYLHLAQLVPHEAFTEHEHNDAVRLAESDVRKFSMRVVPQRTLEVCLAQFWSQKDPVQLDLKVEFFGVDCISDGAKIVFDPAADPVKQIALQTPPTLREITDLNLSVKLDRLHQHVRPKSCDIAPLKDERNRLMNGKMYYEAVLQYDLPKVEEAGEYAVHVAGLSDRLYDSIVDSQMTMIFNSHKKLIKVSDWHGTSKYKFKLSKGSHTARLRVVHDSLDALERCKQSCLVLVKFLGKAVELSLHKSYQDAMTREGKLGKLKLFAGATHMVFAAAAAAKDLPKDARHGDVLAGKLALKNDAKLDIWYTVPPKETDFDKAKKDENSLDEKLEKLDTRTAEEKLNEYLLDKQLEYVAKLLDKKDKKDEARAIHARLLKESPTSLKVLAARLQMLNAALQDRPAGADSSAAAAAATAAAEDTRRELIDTANRIVAAIDFDKLAAHLGSLPKSKDDSGIDAASLDQTLQEKKAAKDFAEQKDLLVNALLQKLICLLDTADNGEQDDSGVSDADIKATMKLLRKLQDTGADKFLPVETRFDLHFGATGSALKKINKSIQDNPNTPEEKKLAEQRVKIVARQQWRPLAWLFQAWAIANYPAKYPLF